ncbi:tripartite tricarboxylate transporter substrate binding protein [Ancylobacter sp. Lp-2]|uniref:Bug family tripartite tricarboxylate transporter substrate binding protein n=1 Tax=Ancylobacter sp. Lp-2 TaxID=2881339 RepID=UPI001E62DE09|nr:tripartite tricarboxylate transporter substrate binding protein [Ancylobacter sp. Lp-2]MCB4768783.1 tripartite tricarboxylate transporter substrate binding protein [Ancylobacter sp. Lp-2]
MKACLSVTRRAVLSGVALAGAVLAAGLATALPASAQADYPNQPITLIVPFAPGGASDFAARLLQPRLSQILGQQIVVENRDGAAGNVGMDLAARAKPDGYTLFLGNVGTVSINPYIFSNLRVKPLQDFVPISIVADTPGLLIANPAFPPNNVKELVEYVKARPGQVNFASPGSGSVNRLEMEAFRREAGLDMIHVPYKGGAGPATADVMGGHVSLMFVTISSGINHVKGGRLKALGVSTKQRVPQLPDVPTMTEQGFPKSVSSSWQGVLAPAGTPQPIINKLHAAIVEAMKDPTIKERMGESGVIAVSSPTPADFKAYIEADAAKWSGVIKDIGVKAD